MAWSREEMAQRAAREVGPGMVVNLGIGIPTLVANYLPEDGSVMLHSENGLLGMGPFPFEGDEDPQVINAGKQTVTIVPGGSTFDSTLSFAMIRGGHVDLAILGAMQVAMNGDLANWAVPGKLVTGMGGAMDLVSGARRVLAVCQFREKEGPPKLVAQCSLPLTGVGCVSRIITDLGVFDPVGDGFRAVELAPGVTADDLVGMPLV
ncbi:MAG: 3-oxoacid CoA-transferase subunit B [Deltaproteobacteria bacterium]|jgi:3-oxoacid CoA-transferase subunit B|nr:3-oxoacid CoA-transferase subunit B [Deltaproteobacteria bacterium]